MSTEAEILAENERAIQAWNNRPRRRIPSPSPRKPDMSWRFNDADRIERQLQEDGHRTWGFVIYRTCYDNDEDWAEFLRRLKYQMEWTFDFFNGMDILAFFTLTIFEDPEHLDGASSAAVREHFRQWCLTAPQSEQKQHQQEGEVGTELRAGLSPRYRYAIQVDAESLHSVVHNAPAPPEPDATKKGWVKLIDASWQPMSSEQLRESRERGVEPYEPIEGVTQNNIGWLKVPYQQVMSEYYVNFRDLNSFVATYRRPPKVMGYPM